MDREFILSQTDGRPMYLQIMEQIKLRISVGDWPEGFKLPSIRELAVDTRVSVITVKRAYQELEHEDVIVTQHGKGSFVASAAEDAPMRDKEIDQYLMRAFELAAVSGLSKQDVIDRLKRLWPFEQPPSTGKKT